MSKPYHLTIGYEPYAPTYPDVTPVEVKHNPKGAMIHEPVPDPPCDRCEHQARCEERMLACEAFDAYIHAPFARKSKQGMRPTRALYRRLFENRGV